MRNYTPSHCFLLVISKSPQVWPRCKAWGIDPNSPWGGESTPHSRERSWMADTLATILKKTITLSLYFYNNNFSHKRLIYKSQCQFIIGETLFQGLWYLALTKTFFCSLTGSTIKWPSECCQVRMESEHLFRWSRFWSVPPIFVQIVNISITELGSLLKNDRQTLINFP